MFIPRYRSRGTGRLKPRLKVFWQILTFGFILNFLITKNSLGTLKLIAAKFQKIDQDVFQACSMIDDIIRPAARVRSNIEEECHGWFEDASRLADKIGATVLSQCQESLGGVRNIGTMHLAYRSFIGGNEFKIQRRQQGWGRFFFPWFHLPWCSMPVFVICRKAAILATGLAYAVFFFFLS